MKRLTLLLVLLVMGVSSRVAAQEEPVDITGEPAPAPLPAVRLVAPFSLEQALAGDAAFQAARARRRSGILLAAIGTPLGLALGGFGAYFWDECSGEHAPEGCSDTKFKVAAVLGYSVAAVSLLVGVPLAISGQVRMSRIRRERESLLPAMSLAPLPGGAQLGATWRF